MAKQYLLLIRGKQEWVDADGVEEALDEAYRRSGGGATVVRDPQNNHRPVTRMRNPGKGDNAHDLLQGVASAIWEHVSGSGRVSPAALQAAQDLVGLYEELNGAPIAELARRFPGGVTGDDLAWFALTPGTPATRAVYVPTFRAHLEGDELVWEGEERPVRNPGAQIVLLIEDDPAIQTSTARMIRKILPDAQVITVDNGDDAIAALEGNQVALVVSDVDIIGNKSGIDVFRWVQQHQPETVRRYVFFSGNIEASSVHDLVIEKPAGFAQFRDGIQAALQPGASVVVSKPVTPSSRRDRLG